ncbi:MAG: hypothetical protein WD011_08710, partial [Nitriliruptoraceae bacterium]
TTTGGGVAGHDPLAAGREAFDHRAWRDAYEQLSIAAERHDLAADDLESLATAAYLTGDNEGAEQGVERLHHVLLDAGRVEKAARWAAWLAILLLLRGQHARGGGWLSRAHRILDDADVDGSARGYLLIPVALRAIDAEHDPQRAHAPFEQALTIARRFDDRDLVVLSLLGSGQALVAFGEIDRGISLLDEVMVAVTTGDMSAILAGSPIARSSSPAEQCSTTSVRTSGPTSSLGGATISRACTPTKGSA